MINVLIRLANMLMLLIGILVLMPVTLLSYILGTLIVAPVYYVATGNDPIDIIFAPTEFLIRDVWNFVVIEER